jgi:putative tryptophan/tyrosine transport system substrate-binding protein
VRSSNRGHTLFNRLRRREFISLLGGAAAAWPLAAPAQQPAMPVIGFLSSTSADPVAYLIAAFRQGLSEAGYVEGRNVAIEYRWAEGQYDRLPAMVGELLRRDVAVIAALGTPSALAAKTATTMIPIVFGVSEDPVKLGLVASIARPGGNATGVSYLLSELGAKQLGLLRELVPAASRFGLLVNPNNENAEAITSDLKAAAATIGVEIDVVRATDSRGIEEAFVALIRNKVHALVVGTDPFFYNRRVQLATLATRHALPTIYNVRAYAEAGGLISYGTSLTEAYRQMGVYTARILKGEKPIDLPVVQSTKFDFVINLPTARALGLTIPPMLLARADEVIE